MSYQNDIPQATDAFSKSQSDLLNNFIALEAFMIVNHYDPNDPNAGKHLQINFPVVLAEAPGTNTGEVCIYPAASVTGGGYPALWFQPQGVSADTPGTDFTSVYKSATSGYTYLPSGVLMQWGQVSTGISGVVTVSLSQSYSDSSYSIQLTQGATTAVSSVITFYNGSGGNAITASAFTIQSSGNNNTVRWLTIGLGA